MSHSTSFNNSFKKPVKRQVKQQNPKGCCCKRSQCIKNYCDCYQSMTTCSIYCKCIGCRNTEERVATETPPKKSAQTVKRERAVSLSAKAAATAVKESTNIPLKPAPGPVTYTVQQQQQRIVVPQLPATTAIQLSEVDLDTIITLPPPNISVQTKKSQAVQPTINSMSAPPRDVNVLNPPINAALLDCVVIQALEAEDFGFNELHVGQLVCHEFSRNLQTILKVFKT
ncbi:uncharacterized protein LOC117565638 [Drosophila albomicans]|uniref:Uncharacterized protein LOC117565638 n=1 Tax=Drosophila albomicans TaxID=7291 RepID=A0A6P8WN25_DROAB|nr:uncharacterized protein LOC117565638 [Drosophila albomicans]